MIGRPPTPLADRFWLKVERRHPLSCWPWLAARSGWGYGLILGARGAMVAAHRVVYELEVGPIPAGHEVDHLCRNRRCVNPAHLEPVLTRENVLRGVGLTARNAAKVRCDHGHPLSGVNLYVYPSSSARAGKRRCRTCHREGERRRRVR